MDPETFEGLQTVDFFSLADNNLEVVPENLWQKMPNIKTLDIGRSKIKEIYETSFKVLFIFLKFYLHIKTVIY